MKDAAAPGCRKSQKTYGARSHDSVLGPRERERVRRPEGAVVAAAVAPRRRRRRRRQVQLDGLLPRRRGPPLRRRQGPPRRGSPPGRLRGAAEERLNSFKSCGDVRLLPFELRDARLELRPVALARRRRRAPGAALLFFGRLRRRRRRRRRVRGLLRRLLGLMSLPQGTLRPRPLGRRLVES